MATIKKFEDLEVWKIARQLNIDIEPFIQKANQNRHFELARQVDRSAGSVMDNIAEGFDRGGNRELVQFLYIAKGSLAEVKSQLYRMKDRHILTEEEFGTLTQTTNTLSSKLAAFIIYLLRTDLKGQKAKERDFASSAK